MVSRTFASQVFKFLISGGVAALANLGVGYALRLVLEGGMAVPLSVVGGFVVGTLVSFVLNRTITFAATAGNAKRQLMRFGLAAIVGAGIAAGLTTVILMALRVSVGVFMPDRALATVAHASAVGITTIYNFVAMKYFALKTEPESVAIASA